MEKRLDTISLTYPQDPSKPTTSVPTQKFVRSFLPSLTATVLGRLAEGKAPDDVAILSCFAPAFSGYRGIKDRPQWQEARTRAEDNPDTIEAIRLKFHSLWKGYPRAAGLAGVPPLRIILSDRKHFDEAHRPRHGIVAWTSGGPRQVTEPSISFESSTEYSVHAWYERVRRVKKKEEEAKANAERSALVSAVEGLQIGTTTTDVVDGGREDGRVVQEEASKARQGETGSKVEGERRGFESEYAEGRGQWKGCSGTSTSFVPWECSSSSMSFRIS